MVGEVPHNLGGFKYEKQRIGKRDNVVFFKKTTLLKPTSYSGDLGARKLPELDPQQSYLVEQILELTEDEHSRSYYAKIVCEIPEDRIWAFLSETKQAHLEGRVDTTKARYFTDLVERHLGHRPGPNKYQSDPNRNPI